MLMQATTHVAPHVAPHVRMLADRTWQCVMMCDDEITLISTSEDVNGGHHNTSWPCLHLWLEDWVGLHHKAEDPCH